MLSRIPSLLLLWIDDMDKIEPRVRKLMDEIYTHLNTHLSKPMYQGIKEELKGEFNLIDTQVTDAQVGARKYMGGLEVLRDALHRFAPIRQAFLCGPALPVESVKPQPKDYTTDKETTLSKKVFTAMDILQDEPEKAKEQLDRIYTELTCGG